MKKHPVDDLFKIKLSDLEKRPSNAAWEKIAREQKSNGRKLGMWVWYAAAGILVAFMAGYLAWQSSQQVYIESQVARIAEPERTVAEEPKDEAKIEDSTVRVSNEPVEQQIAAAEPRRVVNKNRVDAITANNADENKSEVIQENNSTKVEQMVSVTVNDKKVELPEIVPPTAEKPFFSESLLANKEEKEENRMIIVSVQMPEDEPIEKGKTSRFSKVFRQLKNVRAGEPVDWKEVGFNPKEVFAKVDGRGRNREEENSEKDQGTKRTKL